MRGKWAGVKDSKSLSLKLILRQAGAGPRPKSVWTPRAVAGRAWISW